MPICPSNEFSNENLLHITALHNGGKANKDITSVLLKSVQYRWKKFMDGGGVKLVTHTKQSGNPKNITYSEDYPEAVGH